MRKVSEKKNIFGRIMYSQFFLWECDTCMHTHDLHEIHIYDQIDACDRGNRHKE